MWALARKVCYNHVMKKLGFDKFETIVVLNRPEHVQAFEDLGTILGPEQDCILAFVDNLADMKALIFRVHEETLLRPDGYLYFAYPKLQNKRGLEGIHRDEIFPHLNIDSEGDGFVPGTKLKFSRMVSLDENYTIIGLRYLLRRPKTKAAPSQRLQDYVQYLPALEESLQEDSEALAYFQKLTPGKQKEWARHIYSGRRKETRMKRLEQLLEDARNHS